VKVYGIDNSPSAYGLRSRYCAGRFLWDFDKSAPDASVAFLKQVGRTLGGRSVLLPTFDTRSLLVADHAEELAEHYVFPRPPAGAARRLYSKREMYRICREERIPTAETRFEDGRGARGRHGDNASDGLKGTTVTTDAPGGRLA
jgi:predicted ATP-grasp superfamily ATP-dependent carboligase